MAIRLTIIGNYDPINKHFFKIRKYKGNNIHITFYEYLWLYTNNTFSSKDTRKHSLKYFFIKRYKKAFIESVQFNAQ